MKETISGGCVAAIIVVLLIGGTLGTWGAKVLLSDFIGRGNAEIELNSANSRIVNYNHYFDLCVSIQNAEGAIDAAVQQLAVTTSPTERDRINANIAAQQIVRSNGINQYNADAKKEYTQARFLANSLPYQLSTLPYVAGSPHTQCAI